MKFGKKEEKEELEKYNNMYFDKLTKVNTCCECEIYIQIIQRFNYEYGIQSTLRKTCDLHKDEALKKYEDKVRSKLK